MALARVQYTQAVAGNKNFTVPMPYISRDHVHVSVDGTDVGFSWLNDNTVQLDTAPAEGSVIDLRRETERVNLLVDFQDASTITEEQLDLSAKQAFFIAQEAFDATGGTMAVANDGSYSANNRRISNLGDPDSDDDAANVRWVKQQYTDGKDAYQERLLAEAARDAADSSATAAATSEANALSYRNTADSHRIAAANSASAAAASQTAAATSETNAAASAAAAKASEDDVAANTAAAASSEANALTYKNNAAASASSASSNATSAANSSAKASQWAELPEDTTVEPGKYSAKHHAAKASASASSAALSATTAAGYRDTANSHKNAAAASAADAASSATAAANSANTAYGSEAAAANSASQAAGYAASLNLPSALGNGLKLLRQKADESGLEYTFGGSGSGFDADLLDGFHESSFMHRGVLPVGTDFNQVVKSGAYRISGYAGQHGNCPLGADYGQLLVCSGGGDTILQIVAGYDSFSLYWRSGNPPELGGGGSWKPWRSFSHDGNNDMVGAVMAFATSSAPVGWLKCDGAAVSRSGYAALFSRIGTIYGSGDGSTTFNLPDLRGEFIRGFDDGRGVDVGRALGTAQVDEFKSHRHGSVDHGNNDVAVRWYADQGDWGSVYASSNDFGYIYDAMTTYTGGNETRPRNVALLYCIKY